MPGMGLTLINVHVLNLVAGRPDVLRDTAVRIEGRRIVGLGTSVRPESDDAAYDLEGRWLLPGLIDLHVHLVWEGGPDPAVALREDDRFVTFLKACLNAYRTVLLGVTTVRDLGSVDDMAVTLRNALKKRIIPGPRVIASGRTIIMTGGHDPFWGIMCDGPYEVLKAVRRQYSIGADVIKISASGGVYGRDEREQVGSVELNAEEIAVACREAHTRGLRVAAHCISEEGLVNCIEGGADTIEHGHFLNEDLARKMAGKGITYVPTVFVYRQIAQGEDIPEYARTKAREIVNRHAHSVNLARKVGVRIGLGTDAGSPGTEHPCVVDEMLALTQVGLTTEEVLNAATYSAAEALGLQAELGSVAVGKIADLIVVDANPLDDLRILRCPYMVIRDGEILVLEGRERVRFVPSVEGCRLG